MSTVRRLLLAAFVVAACCTAEGAHAQVAVGTLRYDANAYVVMENGDVYRSVIANPNGGGPQTQGPWVLACNIFAAGGPPSPVVGVGGEIILTAGGGVYRVASHLASGAILDEVIPPPPGESFVAFGTQLGIGTSLCIVYAVTNAGTVLRGCGGGWESVGTLPTGPTPSQVTTWGSVKSRYR